MRLNEQVLWVPIIILLIAVLPLPYEYYMILRLVIPVFCIIILVYEFRKTTSSPVPYIFLGLAALYNPLMPVHLTKTLWIILNLLSVSTFYFYKGLIANETDPD